MRVLLAFYTSLAAAKAAQEPLVQQQGYRVGEKIPVSCLNRTMYVLSNASELIAKG